MRNGPADLSQIKALVMDVDGILTDCTTFLGDDGQWRRAFNIRDGIGIKALIRAGYVVGMITGSRSIDIEARQIQLGIPHLFSGIEDKLEAFHEFLNKTQLAPNEVAYMGDDLPDLPVLEMVGFAATVPEAVDEVLDAVDYVTRRAGGAGAAREVCDMILKNGALQAKG